MKSVVGAILVGLAVAMLIVVLGETGNPEVWMLAVIGGGAFADLTRRGLSERGDGTGDPTDVMLSAAFAVVLFAAAHDLGRPGALDDLPWLRLLIRGGGLLVIVLGVMLRQATAQAMGAGFIVRLGIRDGHTLVRSGPFRWIRHPNYAALLVIALGTAAALASPWAAVTTLGVWLPMAMLRIFREERLLEQAFGHEWQAYQAQTWRLLPGIL